MFRLAYRTTARELERAVKAAQATLRAAGREAAALDGLLGARQAHTFASRLVMRGVDLMSVKELGGWRTLSMVQRYAHLAPAHLQAAVERLVTVESAKIGSELRLKLESASSRVGHAPAGVL